MECVGAHRSLMVACLALAGCGAQTNAPATALGAAASACRLPKRQRRNPMPVVVMLGDSLTAGYELDASAALPEAVGRVLAAAGRQGEAGQCRRLGRDHGRWAGEL